LSIILYPFYRYLFAVSDCLKTAAGLHVQHLSKLVGHLHGLIVLLLRDLPGIKELLNLLPWISLKLLPKLHEALHDVVLRHHRSHLLK
jgi:hypothetical protein